MSESIYAYHWSSYDCSLLHKSSEPIEYTGIPGGALALSLFHDLPPELVDMILDILDIRSLSHLFHVNKATRITLGSYQKFGALIKHASSMLRALAATGMLSLYSVSRLFDLLRNDRCHFCGWFGPCVSLLRLDRCCYECIEEDPRLAAISVARARSHLRKGPNLKHLRHLTSLKTVPGTYGYHTPMTMNARVDILSLLDIDAVDASDPTLDSLELRSQYPMVTNPSLNKHRKFTFASCVACPSLQTWKSKPELGLSCRGCEYNWYAKDSETHETIEALYIAQNRAFSTKEFEKHAATCTGVMRLRQAGADHGISLDHIFTRSLPRS